MRPKSIQDLPRTFAFAAKSASSKRLCCPWSVSVRPRVACVHAVFTLCSHCVHTVFTLCSQCVHTVFFSDDDALDLFLHKRKNNSKPYTRWVPSTRDEEVTCDDASHAVFTLCSRCVHAVFTGGGGAGHNTQFADYRASGRFSAPRGETLHLFPPRHSKTFMASKRARGTAGDRQWVRGT